MDYISCDVSSSSDVIGSTISTRSHANQCSAVCWPHFSQHGSGLGCANCGVLALGAPLKTCILEVTWKSLSVKWRLWDPLGKAPLMVFVGLPHFNQTVAPPFSPSLISFQFQWWNCCATGRHYTLPQQAGSEAFCRSGAFNSDSDAILQSSSMLPGIPNLTWTKAAISCLIYVYI